MCCWCRVQGPSPTPHPAVQLLGRFPEQRGAWPCLTWSVALLRGSPQRLQADSDLELLWKHNVYASKAAHLRSRTPGDSTAASSQLCKSSSMLWWNYCCGLPRSIKITQFLLFQDYWFSLQRTESQVIRINFYLCSQDPYFILQSMQQNLLHSNLYRFTDISSTFYKTAYRFGKFV